MPVGSGYFWKGSSFHQLGLLLEHFCWERLTFRVTEEVLIPLKKTRVQEDPRRFCDVLLRKLAEC